MTLQVIMLVVFAVWSDRVKMRSPFLFAALLISLAGFVINISDAPIGVKYFGTFLCIGGLCAAFPGTVAWYVSTTMRTGCLTDVGRRFRRLGNNLGGQYKRAIGMALQLGVGNTCGLVASNLYLTTEAPRYILGRTSTLRLFRSFAYTTSDAMMTHRRPCHYVPWHWSHHHPCGRSALQTSQREEEADVGGGRDALHFRRVAWYG